MKSFEKYSQSITEFEPYQYQITVAKKLLCDEKNIILSVPTGAGKTWASVLPFLYAQENNLHFPKKMIYSLPLRALANSIYEDVVKVLIDRGLSEDDITRQTGEYSDDKYFEKDIIFSTIDQTLSNFLCFPLPLSHRQANINAGALIGSYLVFDEFHLLDENLSMSTTLGMLKMLGNLCRCCIMTATLSDDFMKLLKDNLPNYEIITLDDFEEDKCKIGSLLPKKDKKAIQVLDEIMSAQKIAEKHLDKSIVICNRVETAQKIYNDLIEEQKKSDNPRLKNAEIICLHSRFFDDDRKAKESKLKKIFGKNTPDSNAILIATQVIEAGMDISCSRMHTEISPINSFLQRVGRCARFDDEKGKIFIYDILEIEEKERIQLEPETKEDRDEVRKINNKYLPYEKDVCVKTFVELKKYQTLDDDIPKILIESILGDNEKDIVTKMKIGKFNQDKIVESWNACLKNHYRSTIRDIQSVEVTIITEGMCDEVSKYPYRYQSLGMYKWSLVSWLNKVIKNESPRKYDCEDWLIKKLEENSQVGEFENDEEIKFQLDKITDFKSIPNQVFVNAKYFGYHEGFGFNWQYENTFDTISPRRQWKEKKDQFKPLEKDTFYQHNKGLIGAFEKEFLGKDTNRNDKLDFVFAELAKYVDATELEKGDFIRLIKFMIVLHDYGKLNIAWQTPMQTYQAYKEGIEPKNFKEVLGHTNFDSKDEGDIELGKKAKLNTRPGHAGVGAYMVQEILPDLYDNDYLKSGISMAIARHHNSDLLGKTYPDFDISAENYNAMQRLLNEFDFDFELEKKDYQGILDGFAFEGHEEYLVYLFFVRILRLCDQKATEDLKQYFKGQ